MEGILNGTYKTSGGKNETSFCKSERGFEGKRGAREKTYLRTNQRTDKLRLLRARRGIEQRKKEKEDKCDRTGPAGKKGEVPKLYHNNSNIKRIEMAAGSRVVGGRV